MDNQKEIKLLLVAIGQIVRVNPSRTQVKLYASALADLGAPGLKRAIAQMMADPKLKPGEYPMPGKIREYAEGSAEDEALRMTMRIMKAREQFQIHEVREAKAYIGEEGWEIVRAYGWSNMQDMPASRITTLMAQVRDAAKARVSLVRREKVAWAGTALPMGDLPVAGLLEGQDESQE